MVILLLSTQVLYAQQVTTGGKPAELDIRKADPYMVRKRWDYFVRNLMHAEPPKEFDLRVR